MNKKSINKRGSLSDIATGAIIGEATWLEFLDKAREVMPNGHALLFYHDAGSSQAAVPLSAGLEEAASVEYEAHYASINPWMPHAAIRPLGKVVQADEMLSRDDLLATEYYNDFLRPRDICTGFGATIVRDGTRNFLFSVVGADVNPAEAALIKSELQPAVLQLRRAFEHYRKQPDWLVPSSRDSPGRLKQSGFVRLGPDLRVVYADGVAMQLAAESDWLSLEAFGRFKCASTRLMEHVELALKNWFDAGASLQPQVFHVPRRNGSLPLRITVYSSGRSGGSYFRGPECTLVFDDPSKGIGSAAAEFADFYNLSRAEQRVVEGIASGFSPDEISRMSGTSVHTVRTQLKQIFVKSGLGRQSAIASHVTLMAGGGGGQQSG